jgi:hypothetical protein
LKPADKTQQIAREFRDWSSYGVRAAPERIGGDNRPKIWTNSQELFIKSYIFFQLDFFRRRGSVSSWDLGGSRREQNPCEVTILFVPVSVSLDKAAAGWAEDCDEIILRHCPLCESDTIIGHGRRRKQAHDEHHDWIGIRRGRCIKCGRTFTFLPLFSLP